MKLNGDVINSEETWDGKKSNMTFSVENNQMIITLVHGDVTCKRYHDKC